MLEHVPSALFGDFSDPFVADYFNNTIIVGDADWMVVEENIINEHNYSLGIQYLHGEGDLAIMLSERYARKEPMLFYLWQPHTLQSIYSLMRVQLPNDCKSFILPPARHELTDWIAQRYITRPRFLARWCGQGWVNTAPRHLISRNHFHWTAIKWLNCLRVCTSTRHCLTSRVSGCERTNRSGRIGFVLVSNSWNWSAYLIIQP